ncbi:histidinol-phosphate transaminase [Xiashengella succiniciproducens]|jgi:histidinol-phosphate aminotransferase|uniref:Histidinol-phosphate aminotransferase n=1 Tax=Xiashengella succiniciproducens TaxID=2949635 RepID=A0A9J6ZQF4_9BACT|nr:histidinol-phosphate transaminase [Alkaliflexus sp. Ai-910]MDI9538413.1 histidinol-phosphate transaminase [Bacteroidota bacterium]URW80106.1 histidinol-phosphate transaminase [Alkaliflexus sp. Ai-910]HHU00581.1 histidinol-phosphate transaminase [Bacteroidales bacterium]
MKPLEELLRPNILNLKPYSSARDEYTGDSGIFLDANESPFNYPYNRYPDPYQRKLKQVIGKVKSVEPDHIFLGNGSDEAIDLLFRAFCRPGIDNVVAIDPTYGMYSVAAATNDTPVKSVLLNEDFSLSAEAVLAAADNNTKLIWLCSPNNPTGNCFDNAAIEKIVRDFAGIVVLDEAYTDFAPGTSFLPRLGEYPNLVILQTFSKAWGMAGIRLGMAFARPEIIRVLSRIKYPYNLNILTQKKALELIESNKDRVKFWVEQLITERGRLADFLLTLPFVRKVFPSDANFLLVSTDDPKGIYNHLIDKEIIVRDRSSVTLCEGCLRITVGTHDENVSLAEALKKFR